MTSFGRSPELQDRLDFRLLQFGPVALYYQSTVLDRDVAGVSGLGYEVRRLDLEAADADAFHDLISSSLNFPDYYGRNLDALNDCVSELPYSFESDVLLVLDSFDTLFRRDGQFAHAVLDVLWRNALRNQLVGHTMLVFVRSTDPRIQVPPVGSSSIYWNPAEFLNESRGV
jgi:RNAse (barnase) inhibitor barstar